MHSSWKHLIARITLLAACLGRVASGATPAEFPFELREGLIWVEVRVAESPAPLHFLLDSGAGLSVINLGTLERISHLRGKRITVQGVETTAVGYWPQHLAVADGSFPLAADLLALDLRELSRGCHRTVDGLVGVDFFRGRSVCLDFRQKVLRLGGAGEGTPSDSITLPVEVGGGALHLSIAVNGHPGQRVRLDTGCAGALHWVGSPGPRQPVEPHVSVALAPLNVPLVDTVVSLGPLRFDGVRTGLHKREMFPGEAGLVGNDLLCRFRAVTVDEPARRIVFEGVSSAVP